MKPSLLLATTDRTWQRRAVGAMADVCTVHVSASVEDASMRVMRKPFDFVVLDARLPGVDGLQIVHALRHTPADHVLLATLGRLLRDRYFTYFTELPKVQTVVLRRSFEAMQEFLHDRVDPAAGRTLREMRYEPKEDTFFVGFRNGKTYEFPRSLLREIEGADDGSAVMGQPRVVDGGDAFVVRLTSGRQYDVAADFVLYHCEPSYLFHKRKPEQQAREADSAARIGRRVRAVREQRGLTQEALAEKAGMKAPNLSRVEAGKHVPSLPTLERVAAALGVRVADLVAV